MALDGLAIESPYWWPHLMTPSMGSRGLFPDYAASRTGARSPFRARSAPQWSLHDNGDGTYVCSYVVTVSGEYELLVLLDGVAVAGSPFRLLVKAGIACPALCVPSGPGLSEAHAGERAKFGVRAVDTNGHPKASGGDFFAAAVHGPFRRDFPDAAGLAMPPSLRLRLSDQRNGHYAAGYAITTAGTYLLVLTEETTGEPVQGSPFRLTVHPGPLHPPACRLVPAGDASGERREGVATSAREGVTTAGVEASVDISLFDVHGNPLPHEAARALRVRFATPEAAERAAAPRAARGPLSPDRRCRPSSSAPAPGGDEAAFASSEALPPPSSATLGVAECKLHPLEGASDGRSTRLVFTPTRAGELSVLVLDGRDALGGKALPWRVHAAEVHADGCLVRGQGTVSAVAGEAATLSVFVRDRFGNLIARGGELVGGELRGRHRSPVVAQTTDLRTGEYQLSYTAKEGGEHALHVFIRREPIAGSPFPVLVHASRSVGAMCELDASQLQGVRVGVPAPFAVLAYDRHKNRALRGGDAFRAALRGPDGSRVDLTLQDLDDGVYSGSVVCRQIGTHYLETFLDQAPLGSSPHAITVESGPPKARCSVARANFLHPSGRRGFAEPGRGAAGSSAAGSGDGGAPSAADGDDVEGGDEGGDRPLSHEGEAPSPTRPLRRLLEAGEDAPIVLAAMDASGNTAHSEPADWHVQLQWLGSGLGSGSALGRAAGGGAVGGASIGVPPRIRPSEDGKTCTALVCLEAAGEYSCVVSLRGEPPPRTSPPPPLARSFTSPRPLIHTAGLLPNPRPSSSHS